MMRDYVRHIVFLALILLISVSAAYCQSISISPTTPQVALGGTVQFSATVTGITPNTVNWLAGGLKGGSIALGTISSTGLYKAPAVMPSTNPVKITVSSTANSSKFATTTVTLIAGTGTHKLTVVNGTGSGTYATGSVVTIAANAPPAGQTFTGWTGATVASATAKTTTITMPASDATVTANYSGPKYGLTVVNGTGSGSYAVGAVVTIKANAAPAGEVFTKWTGATVASATSSTTTVTMPAASTTVTANYAVPTKYTLTVVSGTGGGSYAAGTVVTITANAPASGMSFNNWTGAVVASATSSTTTIKMPATNTTVTANYISSTAQTYTLTVVNGTGSGNYQAGALAPITANAPPAGQAFLDWTETTTIYPSQSSTMAVMPAYSTTVQANYLPITTAQVPYPVSAHPRIWLTPADATRLQSWATSTNPIWVQGMKVLLQEAVNVYNTYYFPGGVQANPFPDPGDVQGYGILNNPGGEALTSNTESWAMILAFGSLVDPSAANRITDAQDARNLLMVAMNQAAQGNYPGAPFRDPLFATYNRGSGSVEQYPLVVDWIYNAKDGQGNAILTAADKATIRKVFMNWSNDCLNAYTDYDDRPSPEGVTNSLQILPNNLPYRMASNNYYLGHARLLTMLSLCMDPSDDPAVNNALPAAQLGNTLRSYILDANGAWLYQEYAMMGDPAAVASSYGISGGGKGFGLASGGLPPEGMLYGESFAYILEQLLALQTSGFNNPGLAGPQIHLIGSPVWDRFITGYMSSLMPTAKVYPADPSDGSVYTFASYGDILREWVAPYNMEPFALISLLDHENSITTHDNAARWFSENATPNGQSAVKTNITDPFSWDVVQALFYYMLLDPAAPVATDPRPTFPTLFVDPGMGRILAHSDWTPGGTLFDYRASWESIYHQDGDAGSFEFFRKGEWLTKEMSNYDNNAVGLTTYYLNSLGIKNWCQNGTPTNLQFYESGEWANGGNWMLGDNAGDPTTITSSGPGYVYAASDLTNLYNRPDFWTPADAVIDVTKATRSIVWLNNDYIIVYDRATTNHTGLFKKFNLSLITNPAIGGNTATETMADGQHLFIQTLLPQNASITTREGDTDLNPIADLEPTKYVLSVQNPTLPADTRFLNVLQGADSGISKVAASYVKSSSGTAFDGAVFGTSAVFFPTSATAAFAGTVVAVPAAVTQVLVTGLAPGTSYRVAVNGGTITITTGGATATADAGGVLVLTL